MSSLKLSTVTGRVQTESAGPDQNGFWRSLSDLENRPEFLEFLGREFPEQEEDLKDPLSRRRFFQLMGASLAFAGVASGCRWEEDKIVPLSRRPEGYIPGVAKHFATAFELGGVAAGLLVTCMDGRPIKIEGNPEHPFTGGASTALAQASILELYDPDRSTRVRRSEGDQIVPATKKEAVAALRALRDRFKAGGGNGLRILSESTSSPTVEALRRELQAAMPSARWHEYEPVSYDEERAGTTLVFGGPHRAHYRLDRALVVAAFDLDFFGDHPAALRHAADFGRARDPEVRKGAGEMMRLYSVESTFSLTGSVADHRLPVRSELVKPILLGVEQAIDGGDVASVGAAILAEDRVKTYVTELAADLSARRGRSLVAVGPRQPAEVHAIAARINSKLGNQGTVYYTPDTNPSRPSHVADIKALVDDINGGKVQALVILGGNPVYDAPADLDFAAALGKLETSMHVSMYDNETSAKTSWHVNRTHYLEAWGDTRSYDGTLSVVQPLVEPLYDGMSSIEVLSVLAGREDSDAQGLVQDTFKTLTGTVFDDGDVTWRKALHDGFVQGSQIRPAAVSPAAFALSPLTESQVKIGTVASDKQIEVAFVPSATYDGRYANNGWLLETPDFITKMTWDNAALISPATAKGLGIDNGDIIKVKIGDRELEIAAHVTPGQAPYSLGLPLGWGRSRAGHVGGHEDHKVDPVGFDTYKLRTTAGFAFATGVSVSRTGKSYSLAETQDHFALDALGNKELQRRTNEQIKTTDVDSYQGEFAKAQVRAEKFKTGQKIEPSEWGFVHKDAHIDAERYLTSPIEGRKVNVSPFDEIPYEDPKNWKKDPNQYDKPQWGMTTDLSKCIGCNSCMLACQSENNVPIVGKEQVIKNREMHWIRVDRFFKGNPNNPEMAFQPVFCQQCENAPCEVVCPVGATVHSEEGLNDMAYNRCVGTRYCANNCPYKVRRFNYHHWNAEFDEARNKVRKLLFNPDVTVRGRGVMEKCTWCVQRIERVKIDAKNHRRPVADGEIKTACQQACPTGAIEFGNLRDESSRVVAMQKTPRAYALLAGLNAAPRHAFLARITNPNAKLAKQGKDHE